MSQQFDSQDQLNDQINDKLSELWKSMKNKKKVLINTLTPTYSRRTENTHSQLNISTQQAFHKNNTKNMSEQNQPSQYMKQKNTKIIDNNYLQMQNMRKTIIELQNQKNYLINQLQSFNANISENYDSLNQSSIIPIHKQSNHFNSNSVSSHVDGKTACFLNNKRKDTQKLKFKKSLQEIQQSQNKQNHFKNANQTQKLQENICKNSKSLTKNNQNLQNLSKRRLIQLLKSTSEYREFAYYYDSHELSYLKRLQDQHKKNCSHNKSQHEKKFWAPTQIINQLRQLNKKQKMHLNENQIQLIVGQMKKYFQSNQQQNITKITQKYEKNIKKLQRQKQNDIPYDIVRLSNAKQRKYNQNSKSKNFKANSLIRK